jgi:hypothetical protein
MPSSPPPLGRGDTGLGMSQVYKECTEIIDAHRAIFDERYPRNALAVDSPLYVLSSKVFYRLHFLTSGGVRFPATLSDNVRDSYFVCNQIPTAHSRSLSCLARCLLTRFPLCRAVCPVCQ